MVGLGENLNSLSQMFNTSCTKLSNSTVSLHDQEEDLSSMCIRCYILCYWIQLPGKHQICHVTQGYSMCWVVSYQQSSQDN